MSVVSPVKHHLRFILCFLRKLHSKNPNSPLIASIARVCHRLSSRIAAKLVSLLLLVFREYFRGIAAAFASEGEMGGQGDQNPYVNHPSFNSRPQSPFVNSNATPIQMAAAPGRNGGGSSNRADPYVTADGGNSPQEMAGGASEEHLVTIAGAIVHLVDDQESVLLGAGEFSVVRIDLQNQGIVALVRVGEGLQWPLMRDEQVVKLDPIHYVFSISIVSHTSEATSSGEKLNYGVTFSAPGQEGALSELDKLLEYYSSFSLPTLVHGDKEKEAIDQGVAAQDAGGAAVVPVSVVTGDGKQITEENQRVFWTEMAPNVDDYGNSVAKAIASGAGQLIRGIFWVRDSTVVKLETGSLNTTHQSNPTDKPVNIRPSTLRNLERVKGMTRATDNFAKSVLSGVVSTVGIVPNAIARSKVGRAFFRSGPGEVALASMVSFWRLFDAVEAASKDVLRTGSSAAETIVTHKHGESAGTATGKALGSAGHLVGTAWSVAKVPKALNPTAVLKPSRAAIMELHSPKPAK